MKSGENSCVKVYCLVLALLSVKEPLVVAHSHFSSSLKQLVFFMKRVMSILFNKLMSIVIIHWEIHGFAHRAP